jgi:hypothetical protein
VYPFQPNEQVDFVFTGCFIHLLFSLILQFDQLVVDYIWTELMRRMLKYYNGTNISDRTMDNLERSIFKFLLDCPLG